MALPPETARILSALEAFLDAHHFLATSAASVAIITLLLTTILFWYCFFSDLFPFSMTQLLFDGGVICVMPRAYDHFRGGLYVDGHPAGSHEDAVSVYCTLCGSWLGWRIHNYRFVIHEGQFVLVVCGDGAGIEAVFPIAYNCLNIGAQKIEKITLDDEYWVGPKVELFPINKGEVYMFKYWVASHPLLVKCAKLQ
ncbi:hypothetical protein CK203_113443 [Vitis vinifera]|uniref:Yippee domain-containing protein n=1 Tax=Vitis vinifera TaxID=29760 RepID=A0A438BPD8_VITVI|nr:hypothetical protein CK203_113443 [Vitis vinifera]